MWSPVDGLPSVDYFEAAYPGFGRPAEKLGTTFASLGTRAGTVTAERAAVLGLTESVAVAVGNVDSFVSVPGAGVRRPGTFVCVIGTSICDMVLGTSEVRLPGITGVVRDGILPGMYGYEAGQVAVGDMLAWLVRTLGGGEGLYGELEAQAAKLAPGETGLLALDWFNGNRSILADADLTGVILGLTLHSSPAEIYRALLEAIAFSSRRIMDNFDEHGIPLDEIVACGGIAAAQPADDAAARRHQRPAGARARHGRDPGARLGAVRRRRRRDPRRHRERDRGHTARVRAHVHAGRRCHLGLRGRLRDPPRALRHARERAGRAPARPQADQVRRARRDRRRGRGVSIERLRRDVLAANLALPAHGLVTLTWGNASGIDRDGGLVVIKASGVAYEAMGPRDIVILDLESGAVVQGERRPSTDTPTHLALYRAFEQIGGSRPHALDLGDRVGAGASARSRCSARPTRT